MAPAKKLKLDKVLLSDDHKLPNTSLSASTSQTSAAAGSSGTAAAFLAEGLARDKALTDIVKGLLKGGFGKEDPIDCNWNLQLEALYAEIVKIRGTSTPLDVVDKSVVREYYSEWIFKQNQDDDDSQPETICFNEITSDPNDLCKCNLMTLSHPLSRLLGKKKMMRDMVIEELCKYIDDNGLFEDNIYAKANKTLLPIFGKEKFLVKEMANLLEKHWESSSDKCEFCKNENGDDSVEKSECSFYY